MYGFVDVRVVEVDFLIASLRRRFNQGTLGYVMTTCDVGDQL